MLKNNTKFAGNDAPNVLLPESPANMNYIAKSEVEALDESIAENAHLTFGQLKQKSHDKAWYEAYHKVNGTNIISPITMLEVMDADGSTVLVDSIVRVDANTVSVSVLPATGIRVVVRGNKN